MKKIIVFVILFFTIATGMNAQSISSFLSKADTFLKQYVEDGLVDYETIHKNPATLNELAKMAKNITVSKENDKEYKAFWINAYNILVIKAIVENYPLKSPLDVNGFFDRTKHTIGGEDITLNDIENILLRKNFPSEPRFHFVLVCGGLGCPPIIDEAYRPETLNKQLEKQAELALNDPAFIKVDRDKVKISQIFEWYKGDFTQNGQNLIGFINLYRTEKLPEKIKVSFYPYDWTLNGMK